MAKWLIQKVFKGKLKLRNPLLVEGLPGVGNVGKIALDYLIDTLKPELLYKIHSNVFPHSVFFNEHGYIELPSVSIYKYKGKTRDILLLTGDVQPTRESASYEFCEKILDFAEEAGCKDIITLGGIGMQTEVKNPAIFGAFTDKNTMKQYKKYGGINTKTSDKIEAIVGASGLLLGLARLRNMRGVSLLSETFAHEYHFGFKEAKYLLEKLKPILGVNLKLDDLEKEIQFTEDQESVLQNKTVKKQLKMPGDNLDLPYIG
ncbi:MAG TPA: PAC2 family protein [Candidatus Nanoarchaeia archaeon]|nr:PAC2 family protein [Candidatus Nanoarchaeia archaeon]